MAKYSLEHIIWIVQPIAAEETAIDTAADTIAAYEFNGTGLLSFEIMSFEVLSSFIF